MPQMTILHLRKACLALAVGVVAIAGAYYVVKHRTQQGTVDAIRTAHWPRPRGADFIDLARKHAEEYRLAGLDATKRIQRYSVQGDYLRYGSTRSYSNSDRVRLDEAGLPMVRYGEEFQYNPVTIAQYLLTAYGRYLSGGATEPIVAAAERLLSMQDSRGAFLYEFTYRHYTAVEPYKPGWVSGMAQGVALSALARAYLVTQDARYLEAGNRALAFLNTPKGQGGPRTNMAALDPSLTDFIFFFEYPTEPDVYTLNGFMFTLLGLYDWQEVAKSDDARKLLDEGLRTLKHILPYYDLGALSSYDLSYLTIPHSNARYEAGKPHIAPRYHAVHLTQLYALNSIRPDPVLQEYFDRWSSYVASP